MKKFLFLLCCQVIISCGGNKTEQDIADDDSAQAAESPLAWQATLNDSTGRLEMKAAPAGAEPLSVKPIIEYFNQSNPEIILSFIKTSGDTVYLKIADAHYLTQQMGSTGPTVYLAGLVYNLTDIPGINFVNLDFEEGDHASPGVFTKDDFKDQ